MHDAYIPKMPDHIRPTLEAYIKLMEQLKLAIKNEGLTPAQALMVITLGHDIVKAGDLIRLGYYCGTNTTYNLKTLQESGYIEYLKNEKDRRHKLVRLTTKGLEFCIKLRHELAPQRIAYPA